MPQLVLASASPRRRELLSAAGVDFVVDVSDVPEIPQPQEGPVEFARRLARAKAQAVAARHRDAYVLGADTVVALGHRIFGKPVDSDEARQMLQSLSGQTHQVITAVALVDPNGIVDGVFVSTDVTFRQLSAAEIDAYVASGEPSDKAGAYAIQGGAGAFVVQVDGSYPNVVGLPIDEVLELLRSKALLAAQP
ncbi:MAG: septum formation inhibitor Maf [Deltaproteobacteria bacterium]|nr:septum formation inhibitor Maf [Deltaproteobacteria bacterium]